MIKKGNISTNTDNKIKRVTSGEVTKNKNPVWDEECRKVVEERARKLKSYQKF